MGLLFFFFSLFLYILRSCGLFLVFFSFQARGKGRRYYGNDMGCDVRTTNER